MKKSLTHLLKSSVIFFFFFFFEKQVLVSFDDRMQVIMEEMYIEREIEGSLINNCIRPMPHISLDTPHYSLDICMLQ